MADGLHAKLDGALAQLPRPVTAEHVLTCARTNLPSTEFGQFAKWFGKHSDVVLGRLNA
jgi:hypothetical protein